MILKQDLLHLDRGDERLLMMTKFLLEALPKKPTSIKDYIAVDDFYVFYESGVKWKVRICIRLVVSGTAALGRYRRQEIRTKH